MDRDRQANYGQDAPRVLRNLVIAAAIGALLWGSIRGGFWSGHLMIPVGGLKVGTDRATVIREVTRVLKPGGRAIIEDIRHGKDYAKYFAELGCSDIEHLGSRLLAVFITLVSFGYVRPVTLLVKKA